MQSVSAWDHSPQRVGPNLGGKRGGVSYCFFFPTGVVGGKRRGSYPVEVSMLSFIWLDHPEQAYWIFF